ncbi:MAG: hypothetical protein SWI22_04900 [Pseudomonadota bacterium]|nr:hypothetical protein [Pseudomonadota bacterium]
MTRPAARSWSVSKSLALLAAIFAVVLAATLPSAVAASAAGHPVQLCAGDRIFVVDMDAGRSTPGDTDPSGGLHCADCLASAFVSLLPPPPPPGPTARLALPTVHRAPAPDRQTPGPALAPRPPSTAPPAV